MEEREISESLIPTGGRTVCEEGGGGSTLLASLAAFFFFLLPLPHGALVLILRLTKPLICAFGTGINKIKEENNRRAEL